MGGMDDSFSNQIRLRSTLSFPGRDGLGIDIGVLFAEAALIAHEYLVDFKTFVHSAVALYS